MVGFTADTTPISNLLTERKDIYSQFENDLLNTVQTDINSFISTFRNDQKNAGADNIVNVLQRQIDKWKESSH